MKTVAVVEGMDRFLVILVKLEGWELHRNKQTYHQLKSLMVVAWPRLCHKIQVAWAQIAAVAVIGYPLIDLPLLVECCTGALSESDSRER